ncbi:MAG: PatB family C-S lyase [Fervidobacterium sp.]|nr:PatB family C-S lyase [Fervidobacterium sp.]
MLEEFDIIVNRRKTDSFKWDMILNLHGEDVLPLWVADMDFKTSQRIIDALSQRVQHGIFGYTYRSNSYYETIVNWYKSRYNIDIQSEWIVNGPGVVPMIAFLINVLTLPGDKVIIQPPVYPPFFRVVESNGRRVVENRLMKKDNSWFMDFDNLESLIDERTKLIIISNPHNPVGRVWQYEELERLHDIAIKRNLIIVSDEIHADIIYSPNKFVSLLEISRENVIVLNSPGKTFNIAGLANSYGIIPDSKLRSIYKNYLESMELVIGNVLSIEALKAAYNDPDWVERLVSYLKRNRDYAYNFLLKNTPLLKPTLPEGTYLMWIDCSKTKLENPQEFFLKNARVFLNDGKDFGDKNFVRLNFACQFSVLKEALERIKGAYENALDFQAFKLPDERFEICKEIREEVFVIEQGIDISLEMDGKDYEAVHFILKHFSEPVAVARARDMGKYWKIERVAVRKDFRNLGYGKIIMRHIEAFLSNIEQKIFSLNAQVQVKDFYKKLGYKQVGEEFLEAGISHVRMEKVS